MSGQLQLYIDLTVVCLSFLFGLIRFNRLDSAGRVVLLLLFVILIDEVIAHQFAERFKNNMVVYNAYGLVELCLLILYFSFSNTFFGNKKIAYLLLTGGLIVGLVNFAFFESFKKLNSVYIFFEGFVVIVLALVSFYRMLLFDEELRLHKHPHFWFASVFLFFWSITYLNWGLFPLLKNQQTIEHVIFFIWIVNIVTYGSIGVIFQLYPKKV